MIDHIDHNYSDLTLINENVHNERFKQKLESKKFLEKLSQKNLPLNTLSASKVHKIAINSSKNVKK